MLVTDARRNVRLYTTIKDRKSPLKGSRPSVPHGTNFFGFAFQTLVSGVGSARLNEFVIVLFSNSSDHTYGLRTVVHFTDQRL